MKGITVAMIGDLRHSRVVRSNLWSLKTFGARVILSGPESMRAPDLEELAPFVPLEEAIRQADAVMMLRVQLERHREALFSSAEEYHRAYGLTMERFARMRPHAVICIRDRSTGEWRSPTNWWNTLVPKFLNRWPAACRCGWPCWNGRWKGEKGDESSAPQERTHS